MSTVISESQDTALENVLDEIFMECDVSLSVSTTHSASSIVDEVPICRIVEYMQNQLSIWSIEHLLELRKYLTTVSTNDSVNLRQFKKATKRWIASVQQAQDDNNNVQEKLYTNDAIVDSMKMDNHDITEIKLRTKVRKFDEENITLHEEELVRLEELVANLERQRNCLEQQLQRYVEKCQQLEKENDEQKDKLNEAIKKEKTCASALQRSKKEYENLLKQLEAAEIEVQVIPTLKDKMDKINKEKTHCTKQVAKLKEEFCEKEEEYARLKVMMAELEDTNNSIKESYECMTHNLREKNRQLADENAELQLWSTFNTPRERLSISSIPDADEYYIHSTPYKSEKTPLQNSLYAELKASGFVAECSRNDSLTRELEEELNQYDVAISTLLEKVTQTFTTKLNSTNAVQFNHTDAENTRAYNIEVLKHKITCLLNMVSCATEETARKRNISDSGTQLRADSDIIESLDQFGILSYQNFLTHTSSFNNWHISHQHRKETETDLRQTVSQRVNGNDDDPFLKVIQTNISIQDQNIITPIVEELDRIIQNTISSSVTICKDHFVSRNSRYKSIHTLPSNSQLLQTSLPNGKNSRQTSYQSSKTSSLDVSFARGDNLMQENYDEKSTESKVESYDIPDQENLLHLCSASGLGEDRSKDTSEISSALEMESKVLPTLEETSVKNFQTQEPNGAATVASPRRKISVYYRSFDVVAVKDTHEDKQGATLEVRRSLDNPSMQDWEKIEDKTVEDHVYDQNNAPEYHFDNSYRNAKSDSDSSNSCSPQKRDTLLDDELPTVQTISKKICLAPMRLRFPQKVKSGPTITECLDITNVQDAVLPDTDFSGTNIPRTCLSPIDKKGSDTSVHLSSTSFIDNFDMMDDAASQGCSISAQLTSHKQTDSAKITNSESPHSRTSIQRVGGDNQSCVERSVGSQMSSREYTSACSNSECDPAESCDQYIDREVAMGANEANGTVNAVSLISSASTETPCKKILQNDGNLYNTKQKRERPHLLVRRSFSESESGNRMVCRCKCGGLQAAPVNQIENQLKAFPSLADIRLQESRIVNVTDIEISSREKLTELELQKKYTAFSLCLCTDRITLSRRVEMSLRQRDQSEKNLSCEVRKMQQDIQELAPLCTDRESVERVERVRHRLDMIARCAHRVSCAAETLGAVHQENRVSKAILLADRYLQLLLSRCEKLAANVAETKRILTENNIVIEESSGELSDDLPRIRYRSGTPANNRMMMARRRASVATMSRPGNTQDVIKDTARQRNSVSGRVTLRRPSLNEFPKWELENLNRTDSSSSIGELRDIFEQIESQRTEENNNISNQPDSQRIISHAVVDNKTWIDTKQEVCPEVSSVNESANRDGRLCARSSQPSRRRNRILSWHMLLWTILIFFFGFYVNHVISTMNTCDNSLLTQWSVAEILKKYVQKRNTLPHPM